MAFEKGTISIHAQNLMPVIKKWMYSDKDIFVREIVSNGCDAVAKYKALAARGEAENRDDYRVDVILDKENGTISVSDNGIGMTQDEVVRFIAQVAFSGAEEFLSKYKGEEGENAGIIGHFGLGFYSSFMVSSKVTIDTLSCLPGSAPAHWESEDGMEYEIGEGARDTVGTTVTMTISEDDKEFLDVYTLRSTLEKYCSFMNTPIYLTEVGATRTVPGDEDKPEAERKTEPKPAEQINETDPLWLKRPNDVTEEQYREFYHKVFRDFEEPLFWIHLNAEFPFNLKGILYFPKIKNEFSASEGQIKLYSNQVFVADNIKEIIPEFLLLLKGVVDCPDLPLNVSRSYLQNDGYVKKLSAYITRKVADRLVSEFNTKREDYQKYWDDIHPFVKYGCIRDEKFYDRVKDAILLKTTDGEYMTLKEYGDKHFTDTDTTIYYATDEKRQAQMIALYKEQGKDVVLFDTLIDTNFMSFLEYSGKDEKKPKFMRVDASTDGLTEGGDADEEERKALESKFRKALSDDTLDVKLAQFKNAGIPAMVTVEEQSRRFTEMSRQWGNGFSMPEKRTLTLNASHPLVKYLTKAEEEGDVTKMVCQQVADLAEMGRQMLDGDRLSQFLTRSSQLLTMLVGEES